MSCRYTSIQRVVELGLRRYRAVVKKEKEKCGVQINISLRSSKVNNFLLYILRLSERYKKEMDDFYRQLKWRRWKFRMYIGRVKSLNRLIKKIENTHGGQCHLFYGDWSQGNNQMRGCDPAPNKGMKTLSEKKFKLTTVDEYKTSALCNFCL